MPAPGDSPDWAKKVSFRKLLFSARPPNVPGSGHRPASGVSWVLVFYLWGVIEGEFLRKSVLKRKLTRWMDRCVVWRIFAVPV